MAPLGKYRDLCYIFLSRTNLNGSKSKMHITFRFKFDPEKLQIYSSTSRHALRKLRTNCQNKCKTASLEANCVVCLLILDKALSNMTLSLSSWGFPFFLSHV
jgi:hypothetical protein